MNVVCECRPTVRDALGDKKVAELFKLAFHLMVNACTSKGFCRDDAKEAADCAFQAVIFAGYNEAKCPKTSAHWINYLIRRAKWSMGHNFGSKWYGILSQQSVVQNEDDDEVCALDKIVAPDHPSWERMEKRQEIRALSATLNQLFRRMRATNTTRTVFARRVIIGDTYAEIADDLGLKVNNCYQIVNRVFKALQMMGRDIYWEVYSRAA